MYGGQSTYIPLKVNQSGVIPVIFASSILVVPGADRDRARRGTGLQEFDQRQPRAATTSWFYIGLYTLLIIFFAYFYTAIAFNPAAAGRHHPQAGRVHPRHPAGAADRALPREGAEPHHAARRRCSLRTIALRRRCSCSRSGTSASSRSAARALLITVGVALETMKQIDSQLMMRNYEGFLRLSAMRHREVPASCCSASRAPGRARKPRASRALRRRAPLDRRHVPAAAVAEARALGLEAKRVHGPRASSCPTRSSLGSSRSASRRGGPLDDGFVLDGFPHAAAGARSSTRVLDGHAARPRDQPRRAHRDRARPHRRAPGVRELPARVPREPAADGSTGPATRAAARSCSATTTPRRRSTRRLELYERQTRPDHRLLPQRSGSSSMVDGVGDGDDVFERLVTRSIDGTAAAETQ